MSIETMQLVQIVGKKHLMNKVIRAAVINGNTHFIDAIDEINTNKVKIEDYSAGIDSLIEQRMLKRYGEHTSYTDDEELIKSLTNMFLIENKIYDQYLGYDYNYEKIIGRLKFAKTTVQPVFARADAVEKNISEKKQQIESLKYLTSLNSEIDGLLNMNEIIIDVIIISRENYKKLKVNYENIPAIVLHISDEKDNVVLMTATVASLREEYLRVFESLNYTKVYIPTGYSGSASQVIQTINEEIATLEGELDEIRNSIKGFYDNYGDLIRQAVTVIEIEKESETVRSLSAVGRNLFCLFGFIPKSKANELQTSISSSFGIEVTLTLEDVQDRKSGAKPPTKVRTTKLCKPFGFMIRMYGTPSYDELDPTPFFAISYMFLFGAMFGDLGQGLIIILAGLFVKYKMKTDEFGGILMRLGFSACVFGILYGSFFGEETIIPALLIRPMENILTILVYAIILGFILLTIAYVYGMMNFIRRKDTEEALFSKEGLAGFLFFLTFALMAANLAVKFTSIPTYVFLIVLAVLLLVTVFKQPLGNLLTHKDELYNEKKSDYYLEAGFGSIETILSVVSNLISFIRVGAFALNHVGFFMAFAAIAQMFSTRFGSITMLVIGNVVIIGLEGLIVFIQSMRLEYYELFSKYYTGEGIEYEPVRIHRELN
ncbi:MAG: V-type ATP synthase subunit I [Anaerofustis sp.]